jgi:iron complex outermembrane receptor protein
MIIQTLKYCAYACLAGVTLQTVHAESVSDEPVDEATTTELESEANDNNPSVEVVSHHRQIEEIVVTSTKREESLRDIPASIAAVDGKALEDSGAQELSDFLKLMPGVTQNTLGADQNRVTVRGVGADTARLTTSQTTATLIGETSFSDPLFSAVTPDVNPFDLAAVEILKGPQGTLYGGAGLSGAVRYIPQTPILDEWQAKANLVFGTVDEGQPSSSVAVALNAPIGGTVAIRIVALERDIGGLIDDTNQNIKDSNSGDQNSIRGMLTFQPSDSFQLDTTYMRQRTAQDEAPFASDTQGELIRDTTPGPSYQKTDWDLANLTATWRLGAVDLVSVTSRVTKALDTDFDATRIFLEDTSTAFARLAILQDVEGTTQEIRLVSQNNSNWRWITGVFALDYSQFFRTTITQVPTQNTLIDAVVNADNSEYALFGDTTGELGDYFELNLGGRLYRATTEGTAVSNGTLVAAIDPPNTTLVTDEKIVEQGFNPKVALKWLISDVQSTYISVSRGFRFGGIQAIAVGDTPPTFKSDSIWNYEIGYRSEWFENTLQLDGALYYIDWQDTQLVQRDSTDLYNIIDNVGASVIRGGEIAMLWLLPAEGWSTTLSGSYTDARTAEPFNDPSDPNIVIPSHTRLPGTGLIQTSATLNYRGFLRGGTGYDWSVAHSYTSKAHNDLLLNAEVLGYKTWDAKFNFHKNNYSAGINLTNIGNERGKANILFHREQTQDVFYIRPRAVTFRVSLDY